MAGPYCQYCDNRCFVYRVLPDGSWSGHMTTCLDGIAHDRAAIGYDHATAVNPSATSRCAACDTPIADEDEGCPTCADSCDGPECARSDEQCGLAHSHWWNPRRPLNAPSRI